MCKISGSHGQVFVLLYFPKVTRDARRCSVLLVELYVDIPHVKWRLDRSSSFPLALPGWSRSKFFAGVGTEPPYLLPILLWLVLSNVIHACMASAHLTQHPKPGVCADVV